MKLQENGESYKMLSYTHCILRLTLLGILNRDNYIWPSLVGKPKGERPLGRPRRRWEDNIKMDLREVGVVIIIHLF